MIWTKMISARKRIWLSAGVVSLLAIVVLAGCTTVSAPPYQGAGAQQQQGIWVNGEGKVTAAPDVSTLRLGIEAQESTVAQAQSKASDAMNKIMTALTSRGVAKKDIQTQQFNIQKITRFDQKTQQESLVGYRVTNIVTAKIQEIDKAGPIIDAAA